VIDASVHVFFRSNPDLRGYMHEPFISRGIPDVEMTWYGAPGSEYVPWASRPGMYPASDPDFTARQLFTERGVDVAVLHPMTRGCLPDRHLTSAILAAHNQMLAERWLEHERWGERFRGTIRVNPEDIEGALKEVERWRDHPRMVQLGIPMQSHELYGKPQFWPLWEAAEEAGLPVAAHIETGSGVDFAPTPSGAPRSYPQYFGFMGLNYLYHLMNMIAEGVFERFPGLKWVWADGAADLLTPFSWRMDVFGRPHLEQTPWAPEIPSDYLPGHVHFVQGSVDGPGERDFAAEWLRMSGKEDMIMFGSSYPHWHMSEQDRLPSGWTEEQRAKVLYRNAARLYGIDLTGEAESTGSGGTAERSAEG
jgi:predicted TIM-barrel fold metal-dependent hydrolase